MKKVLPAFVILLLAFVSCKKTENPYSIDCELSTKVAPEEEITYLRDWLDSNDIDATQHPSGFFYVIDSAGGEEHPERCYDVEVTYLGYLLDGSFVDRGTKVSMGMYSIIDGWQLGLSLIGEGGKITLYIPPTLAYGATGSAPAVGPNEYLVFDVTVHTITRRTALY